MYVVKLRYKDNNEPCYANKDVIHSVNEIRKIDNQLQLKWFILKLTDARNLVIDLISRQGQAYGWYQPPQQLDYISIVELSNYAPHREYQVVDFREFK